MEKLESNTDDLICPTCHSVQITYRGEDVIEPCSICSEKFMYLKCYHCKKKIYFKNQNFTDGVNIRCPYEGCGKYFCKSSCGVCERTLYFPDRYQEGSKVKCPFKDCGEEYYKVLCPNEMCNSKITYKTVKEVTQGDAQPPALPYREGLNVCCKKCKTSFQKITCYQCLRRLVWTEPNSMVEGQKIECPYDDCKKCFNKIYCPHCQKCNIFTRGGMEVGTKIQCIYKECGKFFNKITALERLINVFTQLVNRSFQTSCALDVTPV